jgi:hypothetical protein
MQTVTPTSNRKRRGPTVFTLPADACLRRSLHREESRDTVNRVRQTGASTRLFHAIVALGLGAAAAGCGGQTGKPPLVDAAEETPSIDAPGGSHDEASPAAEDAALGADVDAGDDYVDAAGDHWVPLPPVIA